MSLLTHSMILDFFVIISALILTLYATFKWRFGYWKRKRFQHLQPSFPMGTYDLSKSLIENMKIYYSFGKQMDWKHFGVYSTCHPIYFVRDLGYIKNILATDFEYFCARGIYFNENDPMSNNMFHAAGSKWKTLRKKLTPVFTSGKLKYMFKTLTDCGVILDNELEKQLKNYKPIYVKELTASYTTDIIGSCAFGLECQSFHGDTEFRHYGRQLFTPNPYIILRRHISSLSPGLAKLLGINLLPKNVRKYFFKIVKDTSSYRIKNNVYRRDILQYLINNGRLGDFDMDEIVAQTFVFWAAGFETSSNTMTFALYELSRHPEIQEKARREIGEVLSRHNGEINYESVSEMKYVEQIIFEALRKYPVLPALTRECVKDYKVPDCDLIIEKGTQVIIPVYEIHHDEDYFPDADKFDPSRFSDENKPNLEPFSFMGFGGGRRECVGERFGIMQSKVGLITLLKKFRFTLNSKTEIPIRMNPNTFINALDSELWLDYEKIE